jgi:hypothetical protein
LNKVSWGSAQELISWQFGVGQSTGLRQAKGRSETSNTFSQRPNVRAPSRQFNIERIMGLTAPLPAHET